MPVIASQIRLVTSDVRRHEFWFGAIRATQRSRLEYWIAKPAMPTSDAPTRDHFDSLAYSLARYNGNARKFAFPLRDPSVENHASWRQKARAELIDMLGPMPAERVPASPRLGREVARPGYTRVTATFETRRDLTAFGYFLIPEKAAANKKTPAILCLPGHGFGVDDLVGIGPNGREHEHAQGYQYRFAVQCVEHGYAVLALEMLGFGRRRDSAARHAGASHSSCQPAAGAALLLGESMAGWRVWDALRALDLLADRPEVDPSRLGVMGISGGGTVAFYAAALDERIKATVMSGSFCTFRDSILSIGHCMDNYVPGILRSFEVADISGLIAPRGLFCECGVDDTIFPARGVRTALRDAERIFEAEGARGQLGHAFFNGPHEFNGRAAFPWLAEHL